MSGDKTEMQQSAAHLVVTTIFIPDFIFIHSSAISSKTIWKTDNQPQRYTFVALHLVFLRLLDSKIILLMTCGLRLYRERKREEKRSVLIYFDWSDDKQLLYITCRSLSVLPPVLHILLFPWNAPARKSILSPNCAKSLTQGCCSALANTLQLSSRGSLFLCC